nr:hypothetical protein CFP56_15932 [Quercus suber]
MKKSCKPQQFEDLEDEKVSIYKQYLCWKLDLAGRSFGIKTTFSRGIRSAVKMEEAIVEGISWITAKQHKRAKRKLDISCEQLSIAISI